MFRARVRASLSRRKGDLLTVPGRPGSTATARAPFPRRPGTPHQLSVIPAALVLKDRVHARGTMLARKFPLDLVAVNRVHDDHVVRAISRRNAGATIFCPVPGRNLPMR